MAETGEGVIPDRVTRRHIADMFNASVSAADNWTRRYPEFPKPGEDGKWDRTEVLVWHERRWPGGDKQFHMRRSERYGTGYRTALETIRNEASMFDEPDNLNGVVRLLKLIVDTANEALNGKQSLTDDQASLLESIGE